MGQRDRQRADDHSHPEWEARRVREQQGKQGPNDHSPPRQEARTKRRLVRQQGEEGADNHSQTKWDVGSETTARAGNQRSLTSWTGRKGDGL